MRSRAVETWMQFSDAVARMKAEFNRDLRKDGLSLVEFRILFRLDEGGPATMARLADELLITRAGTTLLTDRLESRKLVKRMRKEGDRRLIFVCMTQEGKRKIQKARKDYDSLIEERLGRLSDDELRFLSAVIAKLDGIAKSVHQPVEQ